MTNEQYVEHEVKLRLHGELFKHFEKRFDRIESRMMWGFGLMLSGLFFPAIRHYLGF